MRLSIFKEVLVWINPNTYQQLFCNFINTLGIKCASNSYICINSTRHATHENSVPGRVFCFFKSFCFYRKFQSSMIYDKPPITIKEQIVKLQERGLEFDNIELAQKYFSHISYYRLAGYWWPMYKNKYKKEDKHSFKPNSKFKDVIALYNFDHKLRMLIFDVIEKIEISLRTKLIYHLSHEFDPWWFEERSLSRIHNP